MLSPKLTPAETSPFGKSAWCVLRQYWREARELDPGPYSGPCWSTGLTNGL